MTVPVRTKLFCSLQTKCSLVCFVILFVGLTAPTAVQSILNVTNNSYVHTAKFVGVVPFFDDITRREIEAIEGQTVIIPCTVRNLSREKVVSWIRTKDLHILTSARHTFSSDFRFEAVHTDSSGDFWGLRIRGVKRGDDGQYECQVNTEPKMSLAFRLTVSEKVRKISPPRNWNYKCGVMEFIRCVIKRQLRISSCALGTQEISKWLGKAQIREAKETFVQNGSPFSINCEISHFLKNPNSDVWWLHEDTQISVQFKESRITIKTTYNKDENKLHGRLTFDYVTWQDGGTYTCLQPSVKQDSVKLIIVEAESSEAMQRDFPVASHSTKFNIFLNFNIFLVVSTKLF